MALETVGKKSSKFRVQGLKFKAHLPARKKLFWQE